MSILNKDVIQSSYDIRDYGICAAGSLPAAYTCPYTVRVKNQGNKPTCTAHALSSIVEYHHLKDTQQKQSFSTEFIYGTRQIGYYYGEGLSIRDGLTTLLHYGDPTAMECPGNNNLQEAVNKVVNNWDKYVELGKPHRISAYYRCKTNDEIKTALMTHGPVVIAMNTYDEAKIIDDIYICDTSKPHGNHCVFIYGWNEQGWLIQNSWGIWYAGDGKFILPFDFKMNEAWGISDEITDNIQIKSNNWFIDLVSKAINSICNFFLFKVKPFFKS